MGDGQVGPHPAGASEARGAGTPIASVIVPAHDEAAVIGRLLDALAEEAPGEIEVVVACNGCTDATADIARSHGARVVEVDTPSKIAALNAGDEAATAFPRLYVDADVRLTGRAVADVAQALAEPAVLCAAPPLAVELRDRPWAIRAYYAVWCRIPYLQDRYVGSGVFAMSEAGRARFARFPDVIADDLFARNLFAGSERAVVPTAPFVIEAPWTLRALIRRRIRIDAGNRELARRSDLPALPGADDRTGRWWRVVVAQPWLAPAAIWYVTVNLVARLIGRRTSARADRVDWGRDDTTRRVTPSEA
jgi:glycosyltransferase involved in cell wall biosynthesis